MNATQIDLNFSETKNQLKAVGDLLSVCEDKELLEDSIAYIGHLIIKMSEELEKDFEMIYFECLKSKDGGMNNE